MYFNIKSFLSLAAVCLMIFACIITTGYVRESKETEKLKEQINTFVLAEKGELIPILFVKMHKKIKNFGRIFV